MVSINTIEEFWAHWGEMNKPHKLLPSYFTLRLFRKGVKPTWEDSQNANGGKFVRFIVLLIDNC